MRNGTECRKRDQSYTFLSIHILYWCYFCHACARNPIRLTTLIYSPCYREGIQSAQRTVQKLSRDHRRHTPTRASISNIAKRALRNLTCFPKASKQDHGVERSLPRPSILSSFHVNPCNLGNVSKNNEIEHSLSPSSVLGSPNRSCPSTWARSTRMPSFVRRDTFRVPHFISKAARHSL